MKKQEKSTIKKDYIHIIMWLVFLCFFVVFAFNNFTYAQFMTTNSNSDNATMAKFYINSPNTDSISFDFNGNIASEKTLSFQILNFKENVSNEVLLEYSIRVVSVYGNLPLEYKLVCTSIDEGNNVSTNDTFYSHGAEWSSGIMLAKTHCTHNYTLTIRWQSGQYDADTYSNEIDIIKIIIDSEQVN